MLDRLGLVGRITAIGLLMILAFVIAGAGVAYVSGKANQKRGLPLPEQIAAVVELVETSPREGRERVLKAVNSDALSVRVVAERPLKPARSQDLPGVAWLQSRYFEALGGRHVVAYLDGTDEPRWQQLRIGSLWLTSSSALTLVVNLESGEFAVFETRGDVAPKMLGLPPGFWVGTLGCLFAALALLAILREARPLKELSKSVEGFAAEAKPREIEARGAPEIRRLITAINEMQARISSLLHSRTVLLGAISHDLKTFITRLRLRSEMLDDGDQKDRTIRDLEEMQVILDDALAFAQGAALAIRDDVVDLADLLREEAAERPETVRVDGSSSPGRVRGDAIGLRRVFGNIIENACRYGKKADVRIEAKDDAVRVTIDDYGSGIAAGDREAVFEPFLRLETSRNRNTGGTGLGLAIARQIVTAHGGAVWIEAAPTGGARFVVELGAA